jgi:hypothetical protein
VRALEVRLRGVQPRDAAQLQAEVAPKVVPQVPAIACGIKISSLAVVFVLRKSLLGYVR